MENQNHSLLEQIADQQPAAEVSLSGATAGSVSLQEFVAEMNRVSRNHGWENVILSYQDQEPAILEYNPRLWEERRLNALRNPAYYPALDQLHQSYAQAFKDTGHRNCSIRVNGNIVARIYESPMSGWVWESLEAPPAESHVIQPLEPRHSGMSAYNIVMVFMIAAIIGISVFLRIMR
jgi:hypothetical protein